MALTEVAESTNTSRPSPRVRMRFLAQMAEALEDEAAMLFRRAASFEEDEFLLNREIEERQTEINRLQLKLDTIRAERDRVIERIEAISEEATAMRDQAASQELAQDSPEADKDEGTDQPSLFFRRATLAEQSKLA